MTEDEFVARVFAIASEMTMEPEWGHHITGVDERFVRFKSGKNVNRVRLKQMYPLLLQVDLAAKFANPVIMSATKGQSCVNVPMREIARRMRDELARPIKLGYSFLTGMEPSQEQPMIDLNAIQAYHQAYKKALELHRQWEDLGATELLTLYEKFRPLADGLLAIAGDNWNRRADLRRHLGYIDTNLRAGQKGKSTSDINDLIYADFPAMLDHLLKSCSALRVECAPSG